MRDLARFSPPQQRVTSTNQNSYENYSNVFITGTLHSLLKLNLNTIPISLEISGHSWTLSDASFNFDSHYITSIGQYDRNLYSTYLYLCINIDYVQQNLTTIWVVIQRNIPII